MTKEQLKNTTHGYNNIFRIVGYATKEQNEAAATRGQELAIMAKKGERK